MGRPSIILKEILSNQEWELIRTIYMLRMCTEEDMIQKLGEHKFTSILSKALRKIFENEEATDYLKRYTDPDVFQKLRDTFTSISNGTFTNKLESLDAKVHIAHSSKPKVKAPNILEQILEEKEYEIIFALYLDKKTMEKADLECKMGKVPFSYYFHSALRKINQNEMAKFYVLSHVKSRNEKELLDEFVSLPLLHGDLDDSNNPFTQDLLAKLPVSSKVVAQYYLGIGTGIFRNRKDISAMVSSSLGSTMIVDHSVIYSLTKSVLKEIVQRGYVDDYYALLLRSTNKMLEEFVLKILEELMRPQGLECSSSDTKDVPPKKKSQSDTPDDLFSQREQARLNARLKRGYLFGDVLLNVKILSEKKEITIKAMTHHEGLLKISKKSHRMGGMKVFLAIAIFINFIDEQSFSVKEIASILDMEVADVSDILHTKIGDFITLLPEEMKISHAQKLSFS